MAAHEAGVLHRAFSVFVFNSNGQLLLQQRAFEKYHSGGTWTNTCCSHPRPGEKTADAAHRRLMEEMGMKCDIREYFHFIYRHEFSNGLIEHEYDHVFIGYSDQIPIPDNAEVADFRYTDTEDLKGDIVNDPDSFSPWLRICLDRVTAIVKQRSTEGIN